MFCSLSAQTIGMTNGAVEDDGCDTAVDVARVYIGNLKPKANETHISDVFAQFGTILSVWVARKPPGFAFVEFERASDALRAVRAYDDAHPLEILGKRVKVQLAGEKTAKSSSTNTSNGRDTRPEATHSRKRKSSGIEERGRSRSPSRSHSMDRRHRRDRDASRRRRRSRSSSSRGGSPRGRRKISEESQQRRLPRKRIRSRSRSNREHSASRSSQSRSRSRRRSRSRSRSTSRSRRRHRRA